MAKIISIILPDAVLAINEIYVREKSARDFV